MQLIESVESDLNAEGILVYEGMGKEYTSAISFSLIHIV